MDKRVRDDAFKDSKVYTSEEPCDECKNNMTKGFTLLERVMGKGSTGSMWVIKMEAAIDMFEKEFVDSCKDNICFIEPEMAKQIGLYGGKNELSIQE